MSIFETITSVLTLALPLITGLFWNKLKGYRSQIIIVATFCAEILKNISENVLPLIAETLGWNVSTVGIWITGLLGAFLIVIRHFTDTPAAPAADLFKRFSMSKKEVKDEVDQLRRKAA